VCIFDTVSSKRPFLFESFSKCGFRYRVEWWACIGEFCEYYGNYENGDKSEAMIVDFVRYHSYDSSNNTFTIEVDESFDTIPDETTCRIKNGTVNDGYLIFPSASEFAGDYPENPANIIADVIPKSSALKSSAHLSVSTTDYQIRFGILSQSSTNLSLYDLAGRLVCTLVDQKMSPGNFTIKLSKDKLPPGTYIASLVCNSRKEAMTTFFINK
jgi:hypothetical protein